LPRAVQAGLAARCAAAGVNYNCVRYRTARSPSRTERSVVGSRAIPRGGMTHFDPLNLVVVDDDEDVRKALRRLLRSMGHEVQVFASAEAYEDRPAAADCLIVDLRLPGLNGFELRDRLRSRGSLIPIVFITGDGGPSPGDAIAHADVPSLAKPFSDSDLLEAITRAVTDSAAIR